MTPRWGKIYEIICCFFGLTALQSDGAGCRMPSSLECENLGEHPKASGKTSEASPIRLGGTTEGWRRGGARDCRVIRLGGFLAMTIKDS